MSGNKTVRYMKSFCMLITFLFFTSVEAVEPSCQYFGPTEREQLEGQIGSALDILLAEAISESVLVGDSSRTKFKVKKRWKEHSARIVRSEIVVDTRYPNTIQYEKGEFYLLYTTFSPGSHLFYTNVCMGTKKTKDVSQLEWELNRKIPNKLKNLHSLRSLGRAANARPL